METALRQTSKIGGGGNALLFAVLFLSAALVGSMGISSLIFAEYKLGREFQSALRAFAIADAGAECAFYWYTSQQDAFGDTVPDIFECYGQTFTTIVSSPEAHAFLTEFTLSNIQGTPACVKVLILRQTPLHPEPKGVVRSLGQDNCVVGETSFQELRVWDIGEE